MSASNCENVDVIRYLLFPQHLSTKWIIFVPREVTNLNPRMITLKEHLIWTKT
jgi:hypothetical protein